MNSRTLTVNFASTPLDGVLVRVLQRKRTKEMNVRVCVCMCVRPDLLIHIHSIYNFASLFQIYVCVREKCFNILRN
jgi:hypothetical protein